jgi:DNA-binding transcriptional regulator YiaG
MTYSGLPGIRLVSGKWILEEDNNSSDDVTTLMNMRSQFINNWTSRASKPDSIAKKQKMNK